MAIWEYGARPRIMVGQHGLLAGTPHAPTPQHRLLAGVHMCCQKGTLYSMLMLTEMHMLTSGACVDRGARCLMQSTLIPECRYHRNACTGVQVPQEFMYWSRTHAFIWLKWAHPGLNDVHALSLIRVTCSVPYAGHHRAPHARGISPRAARTTEAEEGGGPMN